MWRKFLRLHGHLHQKYHRFQLLARSQDLIRAVATSEAALLMVSCCIMGRPWAPAPGFQGGNCWVRAPKCVLDAQVKGFDMIWHDLASDLKTFGTFSSQNYGLPIKSLQATWFESIWATSPTKKNMPSDHQVPFPRPPCSQLGQELALSMPRSALKMANLWAPGAVPEDQGALKIAQSHSPCTSRSSDFVGKCEGWKPWSSDRYIHLENYLRLKVLSDWVDLNWQLLRVWGSAKIGKRLKSMSWAQDVGMAHSFDLSSKWYGFNSSSWL